MAAVLKFVIMHLLPAQSRRKDSWVPDVVCAQMCGSGDRRPLADTEWGVWRVFALCQRKGAGPMRNQEPETDGPQGQRGGANLQVSPIDRADGPMRESGAWGPVLRVRWSCLRRRRAELRGAGARAEPGAEPERSSPEGRAGPGGSRAGRRGAWGAALRPGPSGAACGEQLGTARGTPGRGPSAGRGHQPRGLTGRTGRGAVTPTGGGGNPGGRARPPRA